MPVQEIAAFTVSATLEEIPRLAAALIAEWQRHCLPENLEPEVNLALEEMLSNVLRHGNASDGGFEATVRFLLNVDEFLVEITDNNEAFDPTQVPDANVEATLEERRPGGLGVFLTRRIMDRFEYRREDGRNVLLMGKRLSG